MVAPVRARRAFAELSRSRHRGRSGPVWVRHVPAPAGPPRVAYAVGKTAGTAVTRNRIRRRLRPLVDELAAVGTIEVGDYLIGASKSAAELDFCELRRHLHDAVVTTSPGPGTR